MKLAITYATGMRDSYVPHPMHYTMTKLLTKALSPLIYINHITAHAFRLRERERERDAFHLKALWSAQDCLASMVDE